MNKRKDNKQVNRMQQKTLIDTRSYTNYIDMQKCMGVLISL